MKSETVNLAEALALALDWQQDEGVAIVHVLRSPESLGLDRSKRAVFADSARRAGDLPDGLDRAVTHAAVDALTKRRSRVYSLASSPEGGSVVGIEGGEVDIFVEVLPAIPQLIIVGAGHIAQPLAAIGNVLGFTVSVLDDRPRFANRERFPHADRIIVDDFVEGLRRIKVTRDSYVVLVTRGHTHDRACLEEVLNSEAAYIGMIGSKMRIRTVMRALRAAGYDASVLQQVYAPIGLDIAAQTPAEIAVAIAAEIVDVRRGGAAPHLALAERLGA